MDWFYADAGKQIGPVDEATFQGLVSAGIVRDETLVWSSGLVNWQPYRTVRPALQPVPVDGIAGETRFCTECGRSYPTDELVAFGSSIVCAACKPVFTQKLREGIRPGGSVRYGGFWIRYLAVLIDSLIFSVVIVIVFAIGIAIFPVDWRNIGCSPADLMQLVAIEG